MRRAAAAECLWDECGDKKDTAILTSDLSSWDLMCASEERWDTAILIAAVLVPQFPPSKEYVCKASRVINWGEQASLQAVCAFTSSCKTEHPGALLLTALEVHFFSGNTLREPRTKYLFTFILNRVRRVKFTQG